MRSKIILELCFHFRLVAATQFQPVSARTAFPCFDEPALRANFSTKISHTPGYFALTNMPNITTEYKADTKLIYNEFETTPSMPTYLLAFVVCDFGSKEIISNTTKPTKVSINNKGVTRGGGRRVQTPPPFCPEILFLPFLVDILTTPTTFFWFSRQMPLSITNSTPP